MAFSRYHTIIVRTPLPPLKLNTRTQAGLVQGVKDFMRKHVKDHENAASSHIGHEQMSSAGDGRKVFVLFEDGSLEVPVNEGMYIGVS